jgi:hypothetical protein
MGANVNTVQARTENSSVKLRNNDLTFNKSELMAGLQAGLGAGYAMGITAIVVSWVHDWGFWTPFNDVAGAIFPALAAGIAFNPFSIVIGLLIHFAISLLLGIGFAALYSGAFKLTFRYGIPVVIGLIGGFLTWVGARYIGLPLIDSLLYGAPAFLVAHLIFGAVMGLLYPLMPARNRRSMLAQAAS